MNSERTVENKSEFETDGNENPFVRMAEEVGEFDRDKQFINAWNGNIVKKMNDTIESPINEDALAKVQIETGMPNGEWEKQFVDPYIYGIRASAAEIGDLAEQFIEDKDGLGIDRSIRGAMELFSEIFGIKNKVEIEPFSEEEQHKAASSWGMFDPSENAMKINFRMMETKTADSTNMVLQMLSTMAHEMWHAHQFEIATEGSTLRRVAYEENFRNYTSAKGGNFHAYASQLIEDEARSMGFATRETLERTFLKNRTAFRDDVGKQTALKKQAMQAIRAQEQKLSEHNL